MMTRITRCSDIGKSRAMLDVSLNLVQAVQALVDHAYDLGYADGEKARRAAGETVGLPRVAMVAMEKASSETYRSYFLRGAWPKVVSDEVRALPIRNLELNTKIRNAVCRAIYSYRSCELETVGELLEVSPADILKDVRVRRGLGEMGIEQLLRALSLYGIQLQYPAV